MVRAPVRRRKPSAAVSTFGGAHSVRGLAARNDKSTPRPGVFARRTARSRFERVPSVRDQFGCGTQPSALSRTSPAVNASVSDHPVVTSTPPGNPSERLFSRPVFPLYPGAVNRVASPPRSLYPLVSTNSKALRFIFEGLDHKSTDADARAVDLGVPREAGSASTKRSSPTGSAGPYSTNVRRLSTTVRW